MACFYSGITGKFFIFLFKKTFLLLLLFICGLVWVIVVLSCVVSSLCVLLLLVLVLISIHYYFVLFGWCFMAVVRAGRERGDASSGGGIKKQTGASSGRKRST